MGLFNKFFGANQDGFANLVLKRLRKIGFPGELTYDAENFAIHGPDGQVINLHNAYAEYQRAEPRRRDALLANFIRAWTAPMREPPEEFDDAKPDLLPVVRSRSYFEVDLKLSGVDDSKVSFPYAVLAEHLCVSLAYDLPTSLIQVKDDDLTKWGVTLYEALEVAKENLLQRTEQFAKIGDSLYAVMHGDSYDASRLVLTQVPQVLKLPGDVVAMVPNRETLLYAGSEDDDALQAMLKVANQAIDHERYISGRAVRLVGDEWEPWLPPVDHPLHGEFALLRLQSEMHDYENQKDWLERELESRGEDVFVASFQGVRDEATGAVQSYCTWTKDVPTLLPKTDVVTFVSIDDEDNPEIVDDVPWTVAERVAGHLLEAREVYPTRYFTTGYPTDEELAQLAQAS
ncbi:MAG: hypothetical protein KDA44_18020 [Planctomycetales bacterium]|nr:hypothetical protein [Planctomycetales bacterium]